MQMNWKVRFKNKVWLTSFISLIVTFTYTLLGLFGVAPSISQNTVMQVVNQFLLLLSMVGVIVDPTTDGISDSDRAMTYDEPWKDK